MIYTILIIVGALGILGTLWTSHPKLYAEETPSGDAWYVLHPENFESGITHRARALLRSAVKWLLIRLIQLYRRISEKVTVKETLKKKIREFLYEHSNDTVRKPSEFWNKVRKPKAHAKAHKTAPHAHAEQPAEPTDSL